MSTDIRDVAARAGVSVGTVSNVINRPSIVSEATLHRVLAVIREVGFVPNGSARQLRAGISPMVSVVIPDISNPFFADVVRGVEERAMEHDLAIFVSSTEGDTERELRYLNVVLEQRPRGLLFTPAGDAEVPLDLLNDRLPLVLVDRAAEPGICSVAVDDMMGGRMAIEHLHEFGHRTVTWVVGPDSVPQCALRSVGIRESAAEFGVEVVEVRVEHLTVEYGKRAARHLLSRELPTAVVCANDLLALGVQFELLAEGTSIPATTSIVGFDDIEFAGSAGVPLTSIARPAAALGSTALEMLLDESVDGHAHRQSRFEPHLEVRSSTGPARR